MAEIIAFIAYFAVVLAIGIYFFIKNRNNSGESEYFLGGRKMGPWVTAMSAQASDMSAWLLMGLPGSILAFGFGKVWIAIGLGIGTIANWLLVAKRLRRFSKAANDSITLPQYLSNRFATANPALRIICAVVFLVCFTVYVASSFSAGATVFTAVFPALDHSTALLIFAAIILIYTFLGGFKAVCWTDFFQGLLMLAALLAVPVMVLLTKTLDFSAINAGFENTANHFILNPFEASWQDIISGLAWGLGYFGMPHILVRFMSIKKPSMVKKSATVAIVWVLLSLGATVLIALFGRLLYPELIAQGAQKTVLMVMAREMFPGFIAGLLMAAIIAASMSTADSQLLVASSSFTSDVYRPVFRKNASDKESLWIGRLVVVAVAVIAYFIAASKSEDAQNIMNMVENAWGGFGAAFGPVVLLSLFWRRFTYKGAVAGIVVGGLTDVLWLIFLSASTGVYELLPGFVMGMLASVAVSLLDKKPSQAVLDVFDRATAKGIDD